MKMSTTLKTALIIAAVAVLSSCRTMQLNQDGKVLGKGMFESAAGVGVAVVGGILYPSGLAPNINVEFQQRFGVGEKTEVQLKVHNDFTGMYAPPYGQGFSFQNEIDFAVKVNTYDKNAYAFSLLPLVGCAFGISTSYPYKGGIPIPLGGYDLPFYINPNAGLALIGSKSGLKYNFYWGGTFNASPNIQLLIHEIPSFETDLTFNWGWEIPKDRIVYRHEIDLFCQLNWLIHENQWDGGDPPPDTPKTYTPQVCNSIGLSYHFSAGVRYNPGQRQTRQ
jgi:hypothetical protein